jgi:hypothetical protein
MTAGAFEAIKATLPNGADVWPGEPDGQGGFKIALNRRFVDRLGAMRGPVESYSDVILRLTSDS